MYAIRSYYEDIFGIDFFNEFIIEKLLQSVHTLFFFIFEINVEIKPVPRSPVMTLQLMDSSFALSTSSSGAIMVVFPFFSSNPMASPQNPVK